MTPKGQAQNAQAKSLDDIGFLVMMKHTVERLLVLRSNEYWQLQEELKKIEAQIKKKSEERKGKQG